MPAPGEDDMGGNPLQEGIWAGIDGGWANRMKRDESFASVKTAYDDDDMDDWGDEGDDNPYMGYEGPEGGHVAERFLVDPEGNVHRPSENLLMTKGGGDNVFHEDIANEHGIPNFQQGHSLGTAYNDGTVDFNAGHASGLPPETLSALVAQNYPSHHFDPQTLGYSPQSQEERFGLEDLPYQPEERRELGFGDKQRAEQEAVQQRGGRPFGYYDNPYFNRGGSTRNKLYLPWDLDCESVESSSEVVSAVKIAFLPLLLGLAGGALGASAGEAVGAGLAGRLLGGAVGRAIGGGVKPMPGAVDALNAPAAAPPEPWSAMSSVHDELIQRLAEFEHPSSNPGYDDTDDPEDVDQKEVNDGAHDDWQKDQDVGADGGNDQAFGPEVMQALEDAEPALMHFMKSNESGADDPSIAHLVETLQKHHPEVLGVEGDPEVDSILDKFLSQEHTGAVPGIGGMMQPAPGTQQLQTPMADPSAVAPHSLSNCPYCGAQVIPGQGVCPQCHSAVALSPQENTAVNPPAPTSPQPSQPQTMPIMAANQGPHNPQQFQAVAEYLKAQGRDELITDLIDHPENYGDILAEIQQKGDVPNPDPDPAAPQMGPPPMDPSQMQGGPPPGGMPMQAAADNSAPQCPKCDSHTTGIVSDKGECHCSNCGNVWQPPGFMKQVETPVTAAHDSLHPHTIDVPAADQIMPDDPARDDNPDVWKTQDGQPLQVGQEYEMYSAKYDVPDVIRIEDIKPDSIEYTLTGEYGLEHRTEVSRQEAQMDGLTFLPTDNVNDPTQNLNEQAPPDQMQAPDTHEFGLQSRVAGKKFTPMEQRDFIDEPGVARNADKLDLEGTHYEAHKQLGLSDDLFLFGL